jgi:hypothetical protein
MDQADIDNRFGYHPPKHSGQIAKYADLRDLACKFATVLNSLCPDSREKSLAITKLEEVVMWANASIARNEWHGKALEPTENDPRACYRPPRQEARKVYHDC